MKTILLLAAVLFTVSLEAQKQKRVPIGNSGCSYLNYCDSPAQLDYSSDSSKVYTMECIQGELTYGVICVQFKKPVEDLTLAEDLMIAYVDYLRGNFTVTRSAGYSKGHRLNASDSTRGISDFWEDSEKDNWMIRGWTNGRHLGFMYVYSKKAVSGAKAEEFFNGFRFAK